MLILFCFLLVQWFDNSDLTIYPQYATYTATHVFKVKIVLIDAEFLLDRSRLTLFYRPRRKARNSDLGPFLADLHITYKGTSVVLATKYNEMAGDSQEC